MSLVVLASASGSPGVTTTALGLALTWPRPVLLVDGDPTGGSAVAAGYLRGQLAPPEAMLDLALAHQDEDLLETLSAVSITLPGSQVRFVAGIRSHEQAPSLLPLWDPLAAALRSLEDTGQDVIVDAGRLGLTGSPMPLLYQADLTVLVARSDLVSLAGARSWAATLKDRFARTGAGAHLGLLLVGDGQPFTAREVSTVLGIPVLASVAWDPATAAVFSHGATPAKAGIAHRVAGRPGLPDTALVRSLRATRSALTATIRDTTERLHSETGADA
ncbi:hypothetical protein GA707_19485 [Nostocoides sp. F2B08]|uniref:hypothetical protein n=1 Tax=Nostocoides sp. F2B08 TaxID=2653936 RepID=UPI001263144C|nr:hypothetical protein [Tetrasphaera sp. F2B08]KAB7740339.1 hypothetical protein GA707_19485 [Tetrasphaera sp. F2B08]